MVRQSPIAGGGFEGVTVHLVVSQEMPADAARVFDTIHDYRHRLDWDTLLRKAETVDGATADRGVVAVCTAKWWLGGYSFRTRYVSFDRPKVAAIKLESNPPFFAKWAASIRHEPAGPGRSVATYTMTFACRPRWIEPLAKGMFRRETQKRLSALASHLDAAAV